MNRFESKRKIITFYAWLAAAVLSVFLALQAFVSNWQFVQLTWQFCRQTVNWNLIYSWRSWLIAGLLLTVILSFVWTVFNFFLQTFRHWLVTNWIKNNSAPLNSFLRRLAREFNLSGRLLLISSDQPLVFTAGLLRPRICVSSGLIKLLSRNELRAVLWHENDHLRHYDPLRIWLVSWLKRALWFLPITYDLESNSSLLRELRADDCARQAMGTVKPLLSALYKIVENRSLAGDYGVLANFATPDLSFQAHLAMASDRVDYWLRDLPEARTSYSWWNVAVSLVVLVSLFFISASNVGPQAAAAAGPTQCVQTQNFSPLSWQRQIMSYVR